MSAGRSKSRAARKRERRVDVVVSGGGSVYLFFPMTADAASWITANVSSDAQWLGSGLAVEHRFARDLAAGMAGDGLVLR